MQNKDENKKIAAFDTLFSNDHIRMCKILLPYLAPDMQRVFAMYIKLAELTYTMNFLKDYPNFDLSDGMGRAEPSARASSRENSRDYSMDISEICEELIPYSSAPEKEKLSQIAGMFRQMKNMRDMMEMMQMMKDLFPEGGGDLSGILSGITGGGSTNAGDGETNETGGFSLDPSTLMELINLMKS